MSVGIITQSIAKNMITSRLERTHFKVVCSPFAGLTPPPSQKKNQKKHKKTKQNQKQKTTTTVPMHAVGRRRQHEAQSVV